MYLFVSRPDHLMFVVATAKKNQRTQTSGIKSPETRVRVRGMGPVNKNNIECYEITNQNQSFFRKIIVRSSRIHLSREM